MPSNGLYEKWAQQQGLSVGQIAPHQQAMAPRGQQPSMGHNGGPSIFANHGNGGVFGQGLVRIIVHGFSTEHVLDKNSDEENPYRAIDYVEYSPAGHEHMTRIRRPVRQLLELEDTDDPEDYAYKVAYERSQIIGNLYFAWKSGEEAVGDGIALTSWPHLMGNQADVIKLAGLYSVQDLAAATESQLNRIRLPNPTHLRDAARRFLTYVGDAQEAERMGQLRQENEDLRRQMGEMSSTIMAMQKQMAEFMGQAPKPDVESAPTSQPEQIGLMPVTDYQGDQETVDAIDWDAAAAEADAAATQSPDQPSTEDYETAVRAEAKRLGIDYWHNKSVARLESEIEQAMQQEAAA